MVRTEPTRSQCYRASGLNLLTAATVLWNTVYLDRTITAMNSNGGTTDQDILRFLTGVRGFRPFPKPALVAIFRGPRDSPTAGLSAVTRGVLRRQRTASRRTTTDFDVGVPLTSATESSGTRTFVSG